MAPITTKQTIRGRAFIAVVVGATLGGCVGRGLCDMYDFVYGPWGSQVGVDLHPAGAPGWWVLGGAMAGATLAWPTWMLVSSRARRGSRSGP